MPLVTQSRYGAACWQPPPRPEPVNQVEIELDLQNFWRLCFRAQTITARFPVAYQVTHRFNYWRDDGNGGYEVNPQWTGQGTDIFDEAGLNFVATFVQAEPTVTVYRDLFFDFNSSGDNQVRLRDTLLGGIRFPAISFPLSGSFVFSNYPQSIATPSPETANASNASLAPFFSTPYKDGTNFLDLATVAGSLAPEQFAWLDGVIVGAPLLSSAETTRPRHNQEPEIIAQAGNINFFGNLVPCFYPKSFIQDDLRSQYVFTISAGPLSLGFGPDLPF